MQVNKTLLIIGIFFAFVVAFTDTTWTRIVVGICALIIIGCAFINRKPEKQAP